MDSNEINKPRFFYALDGIRGIASLLVVLRHVSPFFGNIKFQESYLAVDLFFVLSGVVLTGAYEQKLLQGLPAMRFAWIRFFRIYPLYLVGVLLSLLCILLNLDVSPSSDHWYLTLPLALALLPNLFAFGQDNPFPFNSPSWSLFLELWVNVVYGRFAKLLDRKVLLAIVIISAAGLAVSIYLARYHDLNLGFTKRSLFVAFFRVGYSYFMGVLLYRLYVAHGSPTLSGRQNSIALWGVLILVAILLISAPSGIIRSFFDFAAVTIIFPAIIYGALWIQPSARANKICRFLGVISYPVYAIHAPLGNAVRGILKTFFGVSVESYAPISGVVFIALLVPLCWVLNEYYDVKVRKMLHGMLDRLTESSDRGGHKIA